MAQGDTDISICSTALALLGESAIASFTEGTSKATVCAQLYSGIKYALLAQYPWKFTKKKVQLARLVAAPLTRWQYQYTLPTDMVGGPLAVFPSDAVGVAATQEYDVQDGKLLANYTEVWIDYQYNVTEAQMPPYFVLLLAYVLAMNLAEPVTDQQTKADHWRVMAYGTPEENMRGGYFRVAANIDGRSAPADAIEHFPLVDVRG